MLSAAKRPGYVRADQYLASEAACPVQEERTAALKNAAEVLIRPARAADAGALPGKASMLRLAARAGHGDDDAR